MLPVEHDRKDDLPTGIKPHRDFRKGLLRPVDQWKRGECFAGHLGNHALG